MPQQLVSINEARQRILSRTPQLPAERVAPGDALARVVSADVLATGDTPPFPSSAMDGYAVLAGPAGRELAIVGESRAGRPSPATLAAGQAIRISTGAALPAGADAVIRQEDTRADGESVVVTAPSSAGDHVRMPGEDMRAGTRVLAAGTRLGPAELGAAVAAGARELEVSLAPRVTVICTGDELREPGAELAPGQIHNSNEPMLLGLARRAGAAAVADGPLADEPEATVATLGRALENSDVVLISGGVSVGPHDHVKPALRALGVQEHFWGVALQPGKPTWFGTRADTLVFGLPGNPVSAFVTFMLFASPALAAMQGQAVHDRGWQAELGEPVRRNPAREQAVRVRLHAPDGRLVATPNGSQGSHMMTSLLHADALALIPPGEGTLAAGERVALIPLLG